MTLEIEQYGDVRRLRMDSLGSRAAGMDVSAYVVRGVMIDTGFHHARGALAHAVDSLGVRGVVVTHWHEDHAGNVPLLAARGLPISMRADTEAVLRALPRIRLYRRVVWGRPRELTSTVASFDGAGLECIHTPGHSSDHQVVWDAETGTLFSGDLWLGVRARIFHASEDPYGIIESLQIAQSLAPDRMFDAHRGAVAQPVKAIGGKIQWLRTTIGEIERRVIRGEHNDQIVREVMDGEDRVSVVSRGEYARENLVRAVRRKIGGG